MAPPKRFGSGTIRLASVPYSSIGLWRCLGTSKLMAIETAAPRDEFERSRDMRCHLHGNHRALQRLAGDRPLGAGARRDARDPCNRADQVHESGDVVGAHVEHRAATFGVVEGRVRMPALMAGAHEEGAAGNGPADRALVDELAAGLMRAAEEGVGRAADAQRRAPSPSAMSVRASAVVDAERLFRMDVLAGCERFQADLDVGRRDGEIDDDLDRRDPRAVPRRNRAGSPNWLARASAASGWRSATPLMSRIGKYDAALR